MKVSYLLITSLILTTLSTSCALPGIPDPFAYKPTDPTGIPPKLPPSSLPASLPANQADNFPKPTDNHDLLNYYPTITGKIAYTSNRDQQGLSTTNQSNVSLYLYQGKTSYRLNTDPMAKLSDLSHQFFSDGSYIGYFGKEDGSPNIGLYNQSISNLSTSLPPRQLIQPSLQPENSGLFGDFRHWAISVKGLVAIVRRTSDTSSDIWVNKTASSEATNITKDGAFYAELAWSPDSSKLVYVKNGQYIFVTNSLTHTQLTTKGSSAFPQWSPDGKKILFTSVQEPEQRIHLFTINADGSNLTQLTSGDHDDNYPRWSPDGSKILYASDSRKLQGNGTQPPSLADIETALAGEEIYVINADGTQPRALTSNEAQDTYPVWSPDGSQIAFMSRRDGNREIYIANADGSNPENITKNKAEDDRPMWSL